MEVLRRLKKDALLLPNSRALAISPSPGPDFEPGRSSASSTVYLALLCCGRGVTGWWLESSLVISVRRLIDVLRCREVRSRCELSLGGS